MTNTNSTSSIVQEAIEMYKGGAKIPNIAIELDRSETYIRKILSGAGIELTREKSRVVADAVVEDVCIMYTQGLPVTDIIRKHHISYSVMYNILQAQEIPLRKIAQADGSSTLREQQVIQMYEDKAPLWKITQETGYQQPKIHAILHANGILLRREKMRNKLKYLTQGASDDSKP